MADPRSGPVLSGKRLGKRFGGVSAVQNVDIELFRGECLGLIGPNGAGKTTMLNLLSGALIPDSGAVFLNGDDVTRYGPAERCMNGLARTFQLLRLFYRLTALENVMVGAFARTASRHAARDRAMTALEEVGLGEKAHHLASSLSTGQRKRLELARAMATQPRVLLLDEVLAGVDVGNRAPILDLLIHLRETGLTLLLVEHNLDVVKVLCNRVMAMAGGAVVIAGTADEVLSHSEVIDSYLGANVALG